MEYLKNEYHKYLEKEPDLTFEQWFPYKAHAFRSLVRQLQQHLRPSSKILEVGFGSGYGLSLLESQGHKTYGAEIADYTFDYANRVFSEKGLTPRLVKANGFHLPFPEGTFDFVFNVGTIEHFDLARQPAFLSEMVRVSRDQILISTPNDHPDSYYQKFKQSEKYSSEEEHLTDLRNLCRIVDLEPIHSGGFHSARDEGPSLVKMMDGEMALSDSERERLGFLKYVLANKPKR
jgi:ubiquinone/menaquinone biosynthesis C-methylase UbiE